MGITSSTEKPEFNFRSDQFPWEELRSTNLEAATEIERLQKEATVETALQRVMRDLDALFPPKQGESSTDQPKEGDTDWEEKVTGRFCEFMKGGACKESFKALEDCVDQSDSNSVLNKCLEHFPVLIKCVDAHSNYYQPIITLAETNVKQFFKDIDADLEQRRKQAVE